MDRADMQVMRPIQVIDGELLGLILLTTNQAGPGLRLPRETGDSPGQQVIEQDRKGQLGARHENRVIAEFHRMPTRRPPLSETGHIRSTSPKLHLAPR